MKLQKQLSKIIGSKRYNKYVLVLPEKLVKKAGFKAGDELKADAKKGEVRLKKKG